MQLLSLYLLHISKIVDIIIQDPKYHYRHIRKILRLPYFSIDMSDRIEKSDRDLDPAKIGFNLDVNSDVFKCDICGQVELTLKDINTHKFLIHKVKNICELYVDTSTCPVCLVCFHTRERVLSHIRYKSSECRNLIFDRGPI